MASKRPAGRQRREAAWRASQRSKRVLVGGAVLAAVVAVAAGLLVLSGGTSGTGGSDPTAAPEFSLAKFEGGEAALSDFLGRPLAVTFMHTW